MWSRAFYQTPGYVDDSVKYTWHLRSERSHNTAMCNRSYRVSHVVSETAPPIDAENRRCTNCEVRISKVKDNDEAA